MLESNRRIFSVDIPNRLAIIPSKMSDKRPIAIKTIVITLKYGD